MGVEGLGLGCVASLKVSGRDGPGFLRVWAYGLNSKPSAQPKTPQHKHPLACGVGRRVSGKLPSPDLGACFRLLEVRLYLLQGERVQRTIFRDLPRLFQSLMF